MKKIFIFLFLSIIFFALYSQAFLGIYLEDLEKESYEKYEIEGYYGVLISEVEKNSPADKAKLKAGDVLLRFNDEKIYTKEQCSKILQFSNPGEQVTVTILRNKKEKNVRVTLEKYKHVEPVFLGVYLKTLTDEDYKKNDIQFGVAVEKVIEDSPAEVSGLRDEDVILRLNQEKIYTISQIEKMLLNFAPGDEIALEILRSGKQESISVILSEKPSLDFDFHLPENFFLWRTTTKMIGVIGENLSEKQLTEKGVKSGVLIKETLEESPAKAAGVKAQDILLKINDSPVSNMSDLKEKINRFEVDELIDLTIWRNEEEIHLKCRIGERKHHTPFQEIEFDTQDDKTIKIMLNGEEIKRLEMNELEEPMRDQIKKMKIFKQNNMEKLENQLELFKSSWKDFYESKQEIF
jgi:S1-C subfamily serine protease